MADNPTLPDESYAYDPVGNRLASIDHADWTYNADNELQGYDGVSFEYDENGNTFRKTEGSETVRYVYNVENRLERVEDADGKAIASYYYDPFGRRLWKEVSGARTCYLYADEGLVGEYDADGSEIRTYGWKPGGAWTTDPLFIKVGSGYFFYHNDHRVLSASVHEIFGARCYIGCELIKQEDNRCPNKRQTSKHPPSKKSRPDSKPGATPAKAVAPSPKDCGKWLRSLPRAIPPREFLASCE